MCCSHSAIVNIGYGLLRLCDYVRDVWFEWLLRHHALLLSLSNTLRHLCEYMHPCECVGVGHFCCEVTWPTSWWGRRPIQMWPIFHILYLMSLYRTVLRADSFDMHGLLSTNVDRKKDCIDPFPLALLLSGLIESDLLCSCLMLCPALLYSVQNYSVLFCLVTSCLVLCHAVLTHIASFLRFTVPYSMPFSAISHCGVCVTLHNAPSIHFYVYFLSKPYLTVVFSYTHWSISSYIRSTICHGACEALLFFIPSAPLLCSLSLHFCHFQVTMRSMSTCVVVDIFNV